MSTRHRNLGLAATGLLALAIYSIACRASFSPDGKKVLIPSIDSVLLFDIPSGKVESLFAITRPSSSDGTIFSAVWTGDGKQAVLAWPEKEHEARLRAILLPVGSGGPIRLFSLEVSKEPLESLVVPPPLLGRRLFFGGSSIVRLDLDTGEVKTRDTGRETYLYGHDGKIDFFAEMEGEDKGCEIGGLHPEDLTEEPVLKLKEAEIGKVNGFLAFAKDGRIALASEKDGKQAISIVSGKSVERTVPLGPTDQVGRLGNLQWSFDGKTILAAFAKKADGGGCRLGIVEVPLAGGDSPRTIPIFRAGEGETESDRDRTMVVFFQIALSGDGKTLAASSAYLDDDKSMEAEDRALFLVDLTSPERKVTRIPIPLPQAPGASGKKE